MMDIDWGALSAGLAFGAAMGALYFAGLAFGMRIALGVARPAATLMLSSVLRIVLLLTAGWAVAQTGTWAFVGYALAFLFVRLVVVTLANRAPTGRTTWN